VALEANQSVIIVLNQRTVTSRVIRCIRNEVYMDALKETETEFTPMPGQKISLRWSEDQSLYQQFALVTDLLDPIPIMVAKMEGTPRVVEFRQSFRVRMQLPLEYGLVRPDSELLVTTTQDISATGLRFPSAVKLWMGLELRLRVRLEQRAIDIIGKVVRVALQPREVRGRESWETAVQFTALAADDRKFLDQWVRNAYARLQLRSR